MSQTVTLELPDELYAAMLQTAGNNAQTPNEWLLANLRSLIPHIPVSADNDEDDTAWTAEEEAAFIADQAACEAEWQEYLAETEALRHRPPPSLEEAQTDVRAILARMGGPPPSDEEVIDLAMSEEIAEWNLHLD